MPYCNPCSTYLPWCLSPLRRRRQRVLGACSVPLVRPDVIPDVEVPGGLDAREDARHGLFLVVVGVATLSLVPYRGGP
jgi:hypothetical protein